MNILMATSLRMCESWKILLTLLININPPPCSRQPPILLSNSLPLVPPKLVKHVEEGLFIEMFELLLCVQQIGTVKISLLALSTSPLNSQTLQTGYTVLGINIANISHTAPNHIADLISYQRLTIQDSQDRCEEC